MKNQFNLYSIFLFCFFLASCEKFVVETSDVTLSGKYVVSMIDITNVDQSTEKDSLYRVGSTYFNKENMSDPFDSIVINRFYLHLDYSTIRFNLVGVTQEGRDIWEYGESNNPIFYQILSNNAYNSGYLRFTYRSTNNETNTLTFLIEDDGYETLQLKSSGAWLKGKEGQKQIMTLYLSRVGP